MLKKFEKMIVVSLIVMMVFVVLISTIELAVLIIKDIIEPPRYWLGIDQLFEIFGFFFDAAHRCGTARNHKSLSPRKCGAFRNCSRSCVDCNLTQGDHSGCQGI